MNLNRQSRTPAPRVILAAVVLWLAGGAGVVAPARGGEAADKPAAGPANYKLRVMDFLKVQVFQEPELTLDVRVEQDFSIQLPLIGKISVKEKTVREIEELITSLYKKDYLKDPQVNLTVLEYAPRSVNVLGAVNNPGAISIPPGRELTLLDAISRAGGFSRLANRKQLILTRTDADGKRTSRPINADDLLVGKGDKVEVKDGDDIFVQESML